MTLRSLAPPRCRDTAIHQPLGVLVSLVIALLLLAPTVALAAQSQVNLALRPVDQPGSYFDLTLRPGETRAFDVELANLGQASVSVRTYAADVYTIINGGFGARLRDAVASGMTLWLDYPTDVIHLPAGQAVRRTFTIRIPASAPPGEYITSLLLENEEPIQGHGDVALDQIVRQAVAVAITVPGPRTPALAVGAATHKVVADKSVVAVALKNMGNVRLEPVAEFALLDATGAKVSETRVTMDAFYAGTETLVEVPLAARLKPGPYTVSLSLMDAVQGVRVEESAIQLMVAERVEAGGDGAPVPGLTEVIQAARDGRIPLWAGLAVLLASLAAGVLIGLAIISTIRRRRRTEAL